MCSGPSDVPRLQAYDGTSVGGLSLKEPSVGMIKPSLIIFRLEEKEDSPSLSRACLVAGAL